MQNIQDCWLQMREFLWKTISGRSACWDNVPCAFISCWPTRGGHFHICCSHGHLYQSKFSTHYLSVWSLDHAKIDCLTFWPLQGLLSSVMQRSLNLLFDPLMTQSESASWPVDPWLHFDCGQGKGVVTYISSAEAFVTGIKNPNGWKLSLIAWSLHSKALDRLIVREFKGQKRSLPP